MRQPPATSDGRAGSGLPGTTVREIWKNLEQVFNIPRDAVVTVNGTRVDDTFVVHAGDELEFTKAAGVKGRTA